MEVSGNTEQMLNQMIVGSWVTQAIYVAAEIGIADFLALGPRTADELARETGTHGASLYRVLRALASIGLFNEDIDGRFSLTPMGKLLGSDTPGSKRSLAIMAGSEFYRSWGGLLTSVETGDSAFDKVFGKPFFQYMSMNPDRWRIYDSAMTGIHESETIPVLDAYDFASFRTVVDVGGGNGLALAAILRRHPDVRGVLFDLPSVAKRAEEVFAGFGLSDRCGIVGGNFFDSVPASCDAYLLRHVIHDWNDGQAIAILRNCRDAMRSGGRVLVVETVIPSGNEPCFGKWLDLMMLVVGGRERTKEQYEKLFSAAGLRLTRIVPTDHEVSVIEGVCAPGSPG
ncbi:MAG TPA: methyltransferase [Candidatus Limnocylindria bacterium]|nr:methyltransferase [Candidatus Limnocylindria bacterium]